MPYWKTPSTQETSNRTRLKVYTGRPTALPKLMCSERRELNVVSEQADDLVGRDPLV
eukprot:CAMPEP_0115733160 /NCGR_PEP_ID=MMETSP0272-20121206/85510_1 /TAXON_ID=71861 /ORGANISM="Scrippsiella trochoidea, Strain CCMP3099" /LENGTH=56 /DNA_ID=CAMNT_0003177125 /DNA_START=13 /DNA_END=180 /DNA_ORIENTATION=-